MQTATRPREEVSELQAFIKDLKASAAREDLRNQRRIVEQQRHALGQHSHTYKLLQSQDHVRQRREVPTGPQGPKGLLDVARERINKALGREQPPENPYVARVRALAADHSRRDWEGRINAGTKRLAEHLRLPPGSKLADVGQALRSRFSDLDQKAAGLTRQINGMGRIPEPKDLAERFRKLPEELQKQLVRSMPAETAKVLSKAGPTLPAKEKSGLSL